MSSNQVQAFDPNVLKDRVRDSVRATIGMLIPEAEWDSLVEKEVKAFFNEPVERWTVLRDSSSYHSNVSGFVAPVSPFRALVWNECGKIFSKVIQERLHSKDFHASVSRCVGDGQIDVELGEFWAKKLDEKMPELLRNVFGKLFTDAIFASRDSIITALNMGR